MVVMKGTLDVFPPEFLERLKRIIPAQQWELVLSTFEQPKPTSFRVNTLKADPATVCGELMTQGFVVDPVAWCPTAYILRQKRLADLQETRGYKEGELYVQSLSSLLPVLLLDPQPGEQILDVAAAPGGKTSHIACLMRGQGRLVANDHNRIRFYKLQATVRQQGVSFAQLTRRDGASFGRTDAGRFDRVLVDAPCGTEGRFYTGRASSYDYWRPRKIHEMLIKQRRLILAGAQALRPGGMMVYSTCTFAPEENEGVVSWLMREHPGVVGLEPIESPIPNTMAGLPNWEHVVFDASIHRTIRVLPTLEMEGFFLAKFCKLLQNTSESHHR